MWASDPARTISLPSSRVGVQGSKNRVPVLVGAAVILLAKTLQTEHEVLTWRSVLREY